MQMISTEKRRTIVGLGLTGFSCARYLASKGLPFRVVDSREQPVLKQAFIEQFPQVELHCGEFTNDLFAANDILIVSPGMALETPAIAHAISVGAEISSDIALFLQDCIKPVIAITGSNGKSTVTTLVAEMLNYAGINAVAAGNIGLPVLDTLTDKLAVDAYVLELSSFQLERLDHVSAKAATILNVTEDHMDRYDSFAAYHAAKQRVYRGAQAIVINREQKLTDTLRNKSMKVYSYGFGKPDLQQFGLIEADSQQWIAFGQQKLIKTDDIRIRGSHNILNVMASLALCKGFGIEPEAVVDVLKTFPGLRHRCEWVADINGVSFYNDSKATNTGASIAAINGIKTATNQIVLIAGGQDKDSDFTELAEVIANTCRKVILIGKDGKKIAQALHDVAFSYADDMQDAVNKAAQAAQVGDIVLLAPACASFDMFTGYNHRGDVFVAAVKTLEGNK